jgi:transcriptional regulator with PAS, ATPase and Fis domain
MPYELQAKLLSALQDREVTRLGDTRPVKFSARVIAATNVNIKEAVAAKKFREDLYFRLNVVEFWLPPLRDRKDDIPQLLDYFMKKYSAEFGMEIKEFDADAREFMKNAPWRGNIRELENVIQKTLIMEKDRKITREIMENYIKEEEKVFGGKEDGMLGAVKGGKAKKEIEMINEALLKSGNNKTKAAEALGVSRRTLLYRIKEYGI